MHDFFKDKVVAVTGGTSGIGEATADCFLKAGAKVAVCGIEKDFENESVRKKADGKVDNAMAVVVDVTKPDQVKQFIEKVSDQFAEIDILYNNAGIYKRSPSLEVSEDDWDAVVNLNLKSYFFTSQLLAKRWVEKGKKGGCIINTASINARDVEPEAQVYCVSKAGVVMLTKCLAADWGQYGIRVNAVAPGTIPTTLNEDMYTDDERKELAESLPLKRLGKPEDIAEAVMFLASDHASYITGQVVFVDGGWLLVK